MHAEIARELAASGDPFALTLNGVRYIDKPPLLYALIVAASALAGPSEAAARSVSAAAALVAVGATAWLGARLLGWRGGLLGGLALLTSMGFFAYGRYVRPETLFVATLAGGFALCLVGLRERRRPLVIAGLAVFGLAALAKDPLGALLPPLAIGAALALAGSARPLGAWLPWSGVAACLVLGFGWWIVAEVRTPGFGWYTAIDNHVLNVARARHFADEDVPLTALQFLAVALLGAFPWVIAAGTTLWSLVHRRAWREPDEVAWVALALWVLGVLGLTTLSPFRLPHYGLPASFAIALLAARGFHAHAGRRVILTHVALFTLIALALALAWTSGDSRLYATIIDATDVATVKSATAGQRAAVPGFAEFQPLFGKVALVFAVGALVTALALGGPSASRARPRSLPVFVIVATMLVALPSVAVGLGLVATHRGVRGLAHDVAALAGPDDIVVHEGPIENSGALEWYSGRRPVIVDGRQSVLGFGAERAEARDLVWDRARLERAWTSGRRVWVVSVRSPARSVVAGLPGARLVRASAGRWLWVNETR